MNVKLANCINAEPAAAIPPTQVMPGTRHAAKTTLNHHARMMQSLDTTHQPHDLTANNGNMSLHEM